MPSPELLVTDEMIVSIEAVEMFMLPGPKREQAIIMLKSGRQAAISKEQWPACYESLKKRYPELNEN
jgi:hypothetical protein